LNLFKLGAVALACLSLACAQAHEILEEVKVTGHYDNSVGSSNAASQGTIGAELLKNKPALRPGEVMEFVPGMVVTQHSGDGKANQYFLRGFNLDHGTDFATHLNGMPINMPSHAHGQGYTDINFLMPELVERIDYRKGPYFATQGDFSAAGAADIRYRRQLAPTASFELGARGYQRAFAGGSTEVGAGLKLLGAMELSQNNGPWVVKEKYQKNNTVLSLSDGTNTNGWSASLMNYQARWTATDQIPERLIGQPHPNGSANLFGRFDSLDDSGGGATRRTSLSAQWARTSAGVKDEASIYALQYKLNLYSNFTYASNGVSGDQFFQRDDRIVYGGQASRLIKHDIAGHESSTQWGIQLRRDRIRVGLFDTQRRVITATTRDDQVHQLQTGLFVENNTQWLPWMRTVSGLRWDHLHGRVNALSLAANSGASSDSQVSPKFSAIFEPWRKTEFFVSAGKGFHSNDARSSTIRIDPKTNMSAERARGLAASRGFEIGARTEAIAGLQSSMALWQLQADSELVYVGDAGATQAGQASQRYGLEWNNRYTPAPWFILDSDLAWSHARFASGERIPNSVERVATLSATYKRGHWLATLATRYIGAGPLEASNAVRSRSSINTNLRVTYQLSQQTELGIDIFNLLNRRNEDIQYFYESQLPQETSPVADRHIHPGEPRSLRLSVKMKF
jgi:outer membrane cobalamin receptor